MFPSKNKRSKVLVLMASFNPSANIKDQVKSILNQENICVDLIISDDKSDVKPKENLAFVSKNFPMVRIIYQRNRSGSAGQNFLKLIREVDLSGYDYISFSDQDDVWKLNKLHRATTILRSSGAVGYSASTIALWPNGKKRTLHQSPKTTKADFLFEGAGQGCTFVLEANFFKKVQKFCLDNRSVTEGFDYHDWLIYILCRVWGMNWYFDKKTTMYYLQHDNNVAGAKLDLAGIFKRLKLISSGWYKNQIILATNISIAAGSSSDTVHKVHTLMNNDQTKVSRFFTAVLFFKHGRRKLSDRVVLYISRILGYI